MSSPSRCIAGVACRILAISALISILFVTGCTSSGGEAQLAIGTLSGGLPAGSVSVGGGAYPSTTLTATGGTAPYTWAVTSAAGTFPPGLTLSTSGTISGSPTTAGTYNFTVTVTDAQNHTAPGNLSITINGKLTITNAGALVAGEVGSSYPGLLTDGGGVGPFTWTLNSGTLPNGLTLNGNGTFTGTITAAALAGSPFTFTAKVTDAQGNNVISGTISITVDQTLGINPPVLPAAVAGVAYTSPAFTAAGGSGSGYTFALASGSISPLTMDPNTGIISGTTNIAGTLQFTVKVTDSLSYSATSGPLSITVNPGAAAKLAFAVQPTNVTAGAPITPAVKVNIVDAFNNIVTGANNQVSLGIGTNPGSGTLTGGAAVSPASGVATFAGLSINKSGTGYTLTASATGGLTGATSSTFNVAAGTASQVVFVQQPTNATAGAAITPAVTVAIEDALGNVVTGASNQVTMAIGTNPGSGTLTGGAAVSPASGIATFAGLSINKSGTGYTLTASATGIATAMTSATFNVTPGAAAQLAFIQQPTSVVAGNSITPGVTVAIEDNQGNVVTGASNQVTLGIGTNPGIGTLTGGTAVSPVNGVATFAGLSINKSGTGYTLAASASPALTVATSSTFNVTAGAATQVVFVQQPTNITAGATITPAVTVAIEDALGNVVTGASNQVTLSIGANPGSGTLTGGAAVSPVNGVAAFAGLSINKVGTAYTLTASSTGGLTGATSSTFNVAVGAASQLVFVQQPTNTTAGASITPAVTVAIEDNQGNVVTGANNQVTLGIGANPGSGTLTGGTAVSPVNGVATFAGLSINKSGTGYTLTASATGGLSGGPSALFNVTAGTAAQLAFLQQPTSTIAAATITPAVTVAIEDTLGNIVTGATNQITLGIGTNPGSGTLTGGAAVSPVNGVATFAGLSINKVGTGYMLSASASPVLTVATSSAFNVTAGAAAQLVFIQQPTSVVAGSAITPAVTVAIEDAQGNAVTSATNQVTIGLGLGSPAGTLGGGAAATPVNGVATFSNLTINLAGTGYTLAATASPALSSATSNVFAVTVGAPAKLAFVQQPTSATAGVAIAPAVTVAIEDNQGNVVTGASNQVSLGIAANPGSGTLTGGAAVSPVNGVATFAGLSINKSGIAYTLAASATGGLTGTTSTAFNVTAGIATQLVFIQQPNNVVTATAITPAVTVAIEDALGNVVTGASNQVTIGFGVNPGPGTLSGNGPVSPVNGVATFPSLTVTGVGSGYTLTASAGGFTTINSTAFNVLISVGPPAKLAFIQQPTSVVAGSSIAPAVTVAIEDASGNIVTTATNTISISFGVNPAGGTLSGTLSASPASGVATFSNLSINRAASGYSLQATSSPVLTGVTSTTFNVAAGSATQLAFLQQPTNVVAGNSIAPAVTVAIEDALGNTVTGATNTITLGIGANPGSGTLTGGTAVSPVNGVATFAALSINKTGTAYTLTASALPALTGPTSTTFNVTAGPATHLAFVQQPTNTTAGASITPAVTVAVEDALGNVVTSATNTITVAIGANPGSGTLSGGTIVLPSGGVATFAGLSINKSGTGYTLTVIASPALTGATSNSFNVTVGAAAQLVFVQQPTSIVAGNSITPAVTVAIEDNQGNVVTTASNQITLGIGANPGSGILTGGAAATPVNGVATFAALSINKSGIGYTLTASASPVLTGVTSSTFNVTAGSATQIAFVQQPTNVVSGNSITPAVTVAFEDALGNVVLGATSTITVAIGTNAGGGTLSGTLGVSAISGVATFSNLSINNTANGYTLTASASGFTTVTSSLFNVTSACTSNCTISGQITGPWVYRVPVTLSGGSTASTTTDTNGHYSFAGLTGGLSYTVTPSLVGYTYSPAAPSFTLNANTTQNFTASSVIGSYSISGFVSYSGALSGITHNTLINVSQCSGCNQVGGTTLSTVPTSGGLAYTVRGLPPGNYTVDAEIDAQDTGVYNASNPAGSYSGTVNITNSNATGITFGVADRSAPAVGALTAPSLQGVSIYAGASSGTALVFYQGCNNCNEEVATSYKLYYGTSSTLAGASVAIIPAGNTQNVYLLHGLTNTAQYYFQMSSVDSNGEGMKSSITGPVAIQTPTGGTTLTGQVTFANITPTGPLTVGLYSQNNGVFIESVPAAGLTSPFTYSINAPAGSYQLFAVLDQNNDGVIDMGDVTNFVGKNGPPPVTVPSSSPASGPTIALAVATAPAYVTTDHQLFSGVSSYSVQVGINLGSKLPISMTLFSAPNVAVPFDMTASINNNPYQPIFNSSGTPVVGDLYQFLVTFEDGSAPQVITSLVTGVLTSSPNQFATTLQTVTTGPGSPTVPEFTWVDPASPPAFYTLGLNLNSTNGTANENWNCPKNGGGFPSGTTSVVFNNSNCQANPNLFLAAGGTYDWSVSVQDVNNNSATQTVAYTVPGGGAAPPTISKSFSPGTIGLNGTSTLTFNINNPNGSTALTGVAVTDTFPIGLQVATSSSTNTCGGTVGAPAGNASITAGSTSVSLSGGGLGAGGSCSFSVTVTSPTNTGTFNNTTGNIFSNESGTGATSNTASLTVPVSGIAPPVITASFSSGATRLGVQSTLTFNLQNPNGSTTLTSVAFSDNLTGGLTVAGFGSNTCGGTLTGLFSGSTSVSLSAATLAPNTSCNFGVVVNTGSAGTVTNTSGAVTSDQANGTVSNTATLVVLASPPTLTNLNPTSGTVGQSITITGTNFGSSQSLVSGTVTFNGTSAGTATSWSSTSITVTVPAGATTGNVVVTVLFVPTATSGASVFTVNAGPPTVTINVPGPPAAAPIQAGAATATTIPISVVPDVSGEMPTVSSFTLNGVACTSATCGTLGSVTGTAGSGSYTLSYTPPASLAAEIAPTLVVSPSVTGFAGNTSFNVYPSGVVVVLTNFGGNPVLPGSPVRANYKATVYNDVGNKGITLAPLTGSGYACPNNGGNVCGTLVAGTPTTSGNTTTIPLSYTPPTSGPPSPPYDRPLVVATSVLDPTQFAAQSFLITSTPAAALLSISANQKFDSALTGGGALGTPIMVSAGFNDASTAKSATWTLTANGAPVGTCNQVGPGSSCTSVSGNLTVPATSVTNGNSVTSTVTYTPPATVPTGSGQSTPTLTATMSANSGATDSFPFSILDGTCGTGNNGVLSGSYAFLLKGGAAASGYNATIGSFTANGAGLITGGVEDFNRSTALATDLTLTGSYSVGSDNRGCLTLTNSNGGTSTYRIALGTISGGTATQGNIVLFNDINGQGGRSQGILKQQNLTGLGPSTFSGTYVFGEDGVDYNGGRVAAAGLLTSTGAGILNNINLDLDDNGSAATITGGSGSYTLASGAAGGRGTFSDTITTAGGPTTSNGVVYIVSSSDALIMGIDPLSSNNIIFGGELKKQTGPFTANTLDNKNYVFYVSGMDSSNGGNDITLGYAQVGTSGAATVTLDENDNGTEQAEKSQALTFLITASGPTAGRMTVSGGGGAPVFYLIDSTQAFLVGTDSSNLSGYMQQQSCGSCNNSSVPATAFFGGGGANTGSSYDSGAATFTPGTPTGTITGADDSSSPNYNTQGCTGCGGLQPNSPLTSNGSPVAYAFTPFSNSNITFSPTATGQGLLGGGTLGYLVSPTKVVFMQIGATSGFGPITFLAKPISTNPAEIETGQQ